MTLSEYFKLQSYIWTKRDWNKWEKRVQELEAEGLTRSDAQGATDCEFIQAEGE